MALEGRTVIDHFAIFVSHGLLLLAAWRLLARDELDVEGGKPSGWARRPAKPEDGPGA